MKTQTDLRTKAFLDAHHKAQVKHPPSNLHSFEKIFPYPNLDNSPFHSAIVDAVFSDSSFYYSTAFAIYDLRGKLWAAGYRKIHPPPPRSVMAAELHAIKDGINFWKHHQLGPLKVFSNSMDAIHSVLSDSQYREVEEFLIRNIKSLVNDSSIKKSDIVSEETTSQLIIYRRLQ